MDIPSETLGPLKDCVKPDIAVGNYYLEWDEQSYGIPQKEVQELKRFVSDIAPYLTAVLYEAAGSISKIAQEKTGAKEARKMEEMFVPQVLVARRRSDFTYTLQMKRDGTTVINRSETIAGEKKAALTLSWLLGELLFDRQSA